MLLKIVPLALLLILTTTAPSSSQPPETEPGQLQERATRPSVETRVDAALDADPHATAAARVHAAFEADPHATAAACREVLRLEIPTPQMRRDRRARRLELTGWTIVGVSALVGLGFGLAAGLHECGEDASFCINGPGIGIITGLFFAAPGLVVGTLVGTLGTVRRRRAQRAGTWSLSWSGSSARFGLVF